MKRWLTCIMAFFCLASTAGAVQVRAFVDRNRVTMGETIQLTVSVDGAKADVDVSPIKDFKVVSQSSGTSIQSTNGRTRMEALYVFTLLPLKKGTLKIPQLPVTVDRETFKTDAITVNISPQPDDVDKDQKDVYVSAELSNKTPYVGQQIAYTFKLFQAIQISNARFQPPEFKGFTAKEIEDHKSHRTNISGREYIVTEVTYILLPVSAGKKNIDSAKLQCGIMIPNRGRKDPFGSFFDDPFFGRNRVATKVFTTEPISLTVRPLPAYDGKTPFSGLVGNFNIHSEIESTRLKTGDSATMSVIINGKGNIMDAEAPELPALEGFKTYTDTPQEDIRLSTKGYEGKKVFRTALVPVSEGKFSLPAISLTYFDVSQGRYRTTKTKPINLNVSPAAADKNKLSAYKTSGGKGKISKKKVEFTGRDILPPKEELDAIVPMRPLSLHRFLICIVTPALLFFVTWSVRLILRKKDDPESMMAQKSLKALNKASISSTTANEFISSLYKALTAAILSKSGAIGESLTYAEAEKILISHGFEAQLAAEASRLLEIIESASYSGVPLDTAGRESLLKQTRDFIRRISK